jgi:hypothetical protein
MGAHCRPNWGVTGGRYVRVLPVLREVLECHVGGNTVTVTVNLCLSGDMKLTVTATKRGARCVNA